MKRTVGLAIFASGALVGLVQLASLAHLAAAA